MKRIGVYIVLAGVLFFCLIQLLPFSREHTDPPTVSEPNWPSPEARAQVKEHCFQCHSNETNWTWYSNIAPASWLIEYDVIAARERLNFSDWKNHPEDLDEILIAINEGEMPPFQYWIFHPSSHMNEQQKRELANTMKISFEP